MEEFNEVRLVLDEHSLSSTLKSQSVLGLRKVRRVREKVVGTVRVHHSCVLDVDAYDFPFGKSGIGLAYSWCLTG